MAALKAPFEAKTHYQLAMKIKQGKLERIPKIYSEELMMFIRAMLEQKPDNRPNTEQCLSHEYISIRLQEKKQQDKYVLLKRKEADYI